MDEILLELGDLARVSAIEERAYPYPWTPGNFRDSLVAGHLMPALEDQGQLVAYAVLMPVMDEIHLLNITVEKSRQGQGLGREMLRLAMRLSATRLQGRSLLLEVRPSNTPALNLYRDMGFETIGRRKDYYPSEGGREDALVLRRALP